MDESTARALLASQADALLVLSRRMAEHGVGERWQGPARRACEAHIRALEQDVRIEARRLHDAANSSVATRVRALSW
jgi:hypothetical protein